MPGDKQDALKAVQLLTKYKNQFSQQVTTMEAKIAEKQKQIRAAFGVANM